MALSFTIRLIYIPREMPSSSGFPRNRFAMVLLLGVAIRPWSWALLGLVVTAACARDEPLLPSETFHWVEQPIAFAPPPPEWRREGDNGGGMLGVRFILVGGGGQCIEIAAQRDLAERDRRDEITKLIAKRGSLEQNEFLHEISLARARTDSNLSEREAAAARAINAALDRATSAYLQGQSGYVDAALYEALAAAQGFHPTLDDVRWTLKLRPEQMQEPDRWRIGRERDTTLAGYPAFAGDDTLITDERPLLYDEIIWVVNRCAFKATYQGTKENVKTFQRVVASIQYPEEGDSARAQ